MRSRPILELAYSPRPLRPGDTLKIEARLVSRSRTPIDAVLFRFSGLEERAVGGKQEAARRLHYEGSATTQAMVLKERERRTIFAEFQLPKTLPPSFSSTLNGMVPLTRIEYRLEVRVDIPWWPDRTGSYVIPVAPLPPPPLTKPRPRTFSNRPKGPKGTELHLELTLDRDQVEPGGQLGGAVVLENVEHHRLRRLELAIVVVDVPVGRGAGPVREIYRSEPILLAASSPKAGVPYPFLIELPTRPPLPFTGKLAQVRWHLEVRAVRRLAQDLMLAPDLYVGALQSGAEPEAAPIREAAPLGRERRALVWAKVAQAAGLANDAERESMSGQFGEVKLELALELFQARMFSIAILHWPPTGAAIEVAQRGVGLGRLSPLTLGDPAFDARFRLRAREPAQLRAFLTAEVRTALPSFERVAIDDDGALLASPGNGYAVEELEPFVTRAVAAAQALRDALKQLPPPAALASCREAWRSLALEHGGRFEVGGFAIRDALYRGARVELVTRFDKRGAPEASVARVLFSRWLERVPRPKEVPAEAQRLLTSLGAECRGLQITRDGVEATLPAPLEDPRRAESLWRALIRLAKPLEPDLVNPTPTVR